MGTTATYHLAGDGVTITYSTDGPTLDIELHDSSGSSGTHQLSASELTVIEPTEGSVEVSGTLKLQIPSRHIEPVFLTTGVELFVAAVQPDQPAEAKSAGVAVLIPEGSPPEFRAVALTGTLSVVTTGGSRGRR